MWYMADATPDGPRQRALRAVVAMALEVGLADKSLRAIAEATDISHRMLIHHFGSKEALLVEVIREVEAQQRQLLTSLSQTEGLEPGFAMSFWYQLRDPRLAPQERLFFEVYALGLQGREWAAPLLHRVVEDWVEPMTVMLEEMGTDPQTAPADARLALAVCRGLLLDVLATGDRAAVDNAMVRFIDLLAHDGGPTSSRPRTMVKSSRS